MRKGTAFANVGGFDPRYFLYFEDVDFCFRAAQRGWTTWFHPGFTFEHAVAGSSEPRRFRMLIARHRSLPENRDRPLTEIAVKAFRDQWALAGKSPWLFPSDENPTGHQKTLKTVWHATLRRAKVPYFRIYDLRSTYATRLSAGGVADEWVTQLLRQGDAKVFKKYSQLKLQMKREALQKLNRQANESGRSFDTERPN